MLATLIQRYDKKIISFQERDLQKFYWLSGATFHDNINTIYQLIKPFLDNKMSIFEEYAAFKFNNMVYLVFEPLMNLFNLSSLQDLLMVVYLANLTKTQLALNEKLSTVM